MKETNMNIKKKSKMIKETIQSRKRQRLNQKNRKKEEK